MKEQFLGVCLVKADTKQQKSQIVTNFAGSPPFLHKPDVWWMFCESQNISVHGQIYCFVNIVTLSILGTIQIQCIRVKLNIKKLYRISTHTHTYTHTHTHLHTLTQNIYHECHRHCADAVCVKYFAVGKF